MSDYSLMNPDHLKKEIRDLEEELIPKAREAASKVCEDSDRIIDYVRDQYNDESNETIVLNREQVADLIQALSRHNMDTFVHYARTEEFALTVYRNLLKDRRWIVGSKLKFLKK